MDPKLRKVFGCKIFIITKDMNMDLNIPRINLTTDLQQKCVGIHTRNSAYINKSDEN